MKMLRFLQIMVLICVLMIPVLIILFLRGFSSNEYTIPILYEQGVEDPYQQCDYGGNTGQHYIPEFELTDHLNRGIQREDMRGKITIVDFFFTSCPSICPVMSSEMERVQDAFRKEDKVQIFSISIDPTYDTAEVLADYAERHRAEKDKWFFLTGNKEQIYDLARCGFVLPTIDGQSVPDDFIHSDKFVLVDELGRIRGYYSGTERESVDRLVLETKILLYDGNKN
ncbi:SCO family protein [Cyclobacterium jeungdonense]|uniref:SCO family protein n=1 Tax=Cyclobacterium jeungdonense TaxID=708087 RepID=A0ABT8C4F3_9BACT|nr:SCO family protein [Cyclobacterium jeungdonense]MDN3687186.1 SCO family protein [Cyclobacterium jeungdonense]